jgi:hypothetical protein
MATTTRAPALCHQTLHGPQGVQERDAWVVHGSSARIPRVLFVARTKGKRGVDHVAVDVLETQPAAAGLERGSDSLGSMIVVPELRGDEQALALKHPDVEGLSHDVADELLVPVPLGAIEVTESRPKRGANGLCRGQRVRDQRSEP